MTDMIAMRAFAVLLHLAGTPRCRHAVMPDCRVDGVAQVARAGWVAIVPANVRHSVKAITDGRAIIVDYPVRRDFI